MTLDIEKIKAAAMVATQGEWKTLDVHSSQPQIIADQGKNWNNPTICNFYDDVTPEDSVTCGNWYASLPNHEANAIHIATANPQTVLELITRLEAAEKDAAKFKHIRSLCGYVENGSDTTFTMFQDDATKDWIVKVGNKSYYDRALTGAIDAARKDQPCT